MHFHLRVVANKKPEQKAKSFIINRSLYVFVWDWTAVGLGGTETSVHPYIRIVKNKVIHNL